MDIYNVLFVLGQGGEARASVEEEAQKSFGREMALTLSFALKIFHLLL